MSSSEQSMARVLILRCSNYYLPTQPSGFGIKQQLEKKLLSKNTPHISLKPRSSKRSTFHECFCNCSTFLKTKAVDVLLIISFF